jgi:hypothetical protein
VGRQGIHTCKHLLHSQTMDREEQVWPYSQIKMCMCVVLNIGLSGYIVVVVMMVDRNEGVKG